MMIQGVLGPIDTAELGSPMTQRMASASATGAITSACLSTRPAGRWRGRPRQ